VAISCLFGKWNTGFCCCLKRTVCVGGKHSATPTLCSLRITMSIVASRVTSGVAPGEQNMEKVYSEGCPGSFISTKGSASPHARRATFSAAASSGSPANTNRFGSPIWPNTTGAITWSFQVAARFQSSPRTARVLATCAFIVLDIAAFLCRSSSVSKRHSHPPGNRPTITASSADT